LGDEVTKELIRSIVRAVRELQGRVMPKVQFPLAVAPDGTLSVIIPGQSAGTALLFGVVADEYTAGDWPVPLYPVDGQVAEYDAGTTYAADDLVRTDNGNGGWDYWQCLLDGTVGITPAEGDNWTSITDGDAGIVLGYLLNGDETVAPWWVKCKAGDTLAYLPFTSSDVNCGLVLNFDIHIPAATAQYQVLQADADKNWVAQMIQLSGDIT
jgi:hypothetical protein